MTAYKVENPFEYFSDNNGHALEGGKIYIGTAGLDAETNQIPVFFDAAETIAATQPITTTEGYPSNNGSAVDFFTGPNYSITVRDKNDVLVYSKLSVSTFSDDALSRPIFFDTPPDLIADDTTIAQLRAKYGDTGTEYVETKDGIGRYELDLAQVGSGDGYVQNGATPPVNFKLLPDSEGAVNAVALGCEVSDVGSASTAALSDSTDKIQGALNVGLDVVLTGFVNIAGIIETNGRKIFAPLRRKAGLWCSTAISGVIINLQGAEIHGLSVLSDFTAEYLVTVGDGVQGSTSSDLYLRDCFVSGAAVRSLLVREFSNWGADRCTFKTSGERDTAIDGPDRASAEIRSVGYMNDCQVTAATGFSMIIGHDGPSNWEEGHFIMRGGRVQTGAAGLVKAVNYDENQPMKAIFDGQLWENPGVTSNPGVNNPDIGAAVVAQGPGVSIEIKNPLKFTMRRATSFAEALDGGKVYIDSSNVALSFQLLGSTATGNFLTTGVAPSTSYADDLYVPEFGYLVEDGGNIYAPKPGLIPFTTGDTFDAAQWEDVTAKQVAGKIVCTGGFPNVRSDGVTGDLSSFENLIQAETTPGDPSISFRKSLIAVLADGTTAALPGIDTNPGPSTVAVTTVLGEYLSNGSAIEVDTDETTSGGANISFEFEVSTDLVGRRLMVSAAYAYQQIGAVFGSDGRVTASISVEDGTGTAFPTNGRSTTTDITLDLGDGGISDWYRPVHVFIPETAGTFTVKIRYDGRNTTRPLIVFLDNVKLWGLSGDGTSYV